jgi:hypothetical protein
MPHTATPQTEVALIAAHRSPYTGGIIDDDGHPSEINIVFPYTTKAPSFVPPAASELFVGYVQEWAIKFNLWYENAVLTATSSYPHFKNYAQKQHGMPAKWQAGGDTVGFHRLAIHISKNLPGPATTSKRPHLAAKTDSTPS